MSSASTPTGNERTILCGSPHRHLLRTVRMATRPSKNSRARCLVAASSAKGWPLDEWAGTLTHHTLDSREPRQRPRPCGCNLGYGRFTRRSNGRPLSSFPQPPFLPSLFAPRSFLTARVGVCFTSEGVQPGKRLRSTMPFAEWIGCFFLRSRHVRSCQLEFKR